MTTTNTNPADRLLQQLSVEIDERNLEILDGGSNPIGRVEKLAPNAATTEDIELALVENGARRTLARLIAADASADLEDWVRAADRNGVSRSRIARLAGLSRPAVYTIVGETN